MQKKIIAENTKTVAYFRLSEIQERLEYLRLLRESMHDSNSDAVSYGITIEPNNLKKLVKI